MQCEHFTMNNTRYANYANACKLCCLFACCQGVAVSHWQTHTRLLLAASLSHSDARPSGLWVCHVFLPPQKFNRPPVSFMLAG